MKVMYLQVVDRTTITTQDYEFNPINAQFVN